MGVLEKNAVRREVVFPPSLVLYRAIPLLIYLCIAMEMEWPVVLHPFTQIVGGIADSYQYAWYIGWFWHAVTHGLNPFYSTEMNWPIGFGLMYNTSAMAESILFGWLVPFTSAVFVYNLVFLLNFIFVGILGREILRQIGISRWLSTWGGAMFCFMPYLTAQGLGHLSQFFIVPMLSIILLALRILNAEVIRSYVCSGVVMGILCAIQFYTSLELTVTLCLASLLFLLLLLIQEEGRQYLRSRVYLPPASFWIPCILSTVILATPGIIEFFTTGGSNFSGREFHQASGSYWVADLFSPIIPTHLLALHTGWTDRITTVVFPGDTEERGNYLGLFFIIVMFVLRKAWKGPISRALLGFAAIMFVLSLGDHLHILGHTTSVPLPWQLFSHIPFLDSALPIRLALYVDVSIIVWIAMSIQKSEISLRRLTLTSITCLLALLSWLPALPYPHSGVYSLPTAIAQRIGSAPVFWVSPNFGYDMQALADSRYTVNTYNMYGFSVSPTLEQGNSPLTRYQYYPDGTLSVKDWSNLVATVQRSLHTGFIVVTPFDPSGVPLPMNLNKALTKSLGQPLIKANGCELWKID